jgi:hypothetical protein
LEQPKWSRPRPKTARKERVWLAAIESGLFSTRELADLWNTSIRVVQRGVARARGIAADLSSIWQIEWIWSANAFIAASQCEWHHGEAILQGLEIGCLFCTKTGIEVLAARDDRRSREEQPKEPPKFQPKRPRQKKGKIN